VAKNDMFSNLNKRVRDALKELDSSSTSARKSAEKLARQTINDLRSAADELQKRLDIGGKGSRSSAAKKGAATRKRASVKRSTAAKKGAAKRSRKTTGRKITARKTTARKTARKR
jgi:hypothetical protein